MNALARLVAAFPSPEIHPATIKVYADALKDQKPEHLDWAVTQAILKSKHFPRVAELLELIKARKIALVDEQKIADQKRLLSEPVNRNPPKLLELLKHERSKAQREKSQPRRLMDFPEDGKCA